MKSKIGQRVQITILDEFLINYGVSTVITVETLTLLEYLLKFFIVSIAFKERIDPTDPWYIYLTPKLNQVHYEKKIFPENNPSNCYKSADLI